AAPQYKKINIVSRWDLACVHPQNFFAATHIRTVHHHPTIKASWPQQRGIKHIRTVRCCHQDDAFVRFEAVHLHQQLIQGLLALVVASAKSRSAVASDSVSFVNEDDAGSHLLSLLETVTNPA